MFFLRLLAMATSLVLQLVFMHLCIFFDYDDLVCGAV